MAFLGSQVSLQAEMCSTVFQSPSTNQEDILHRIERVCANVTESIVKGEVPELCYPSRANWGVVSFSPQVGIVLSAEKKMVRVRLDNKHTVKSFGFMMKVLSIVHKLVQEDKYCTKRDIFYQHPELFGSQHIIDNIVDNVACMLEVPRWKLHILATCKGLVAGDLQFYDGQGRHVDCNRTNMGVQIPAHDKDMLNLHTEAQLVIVVEKDATFQKLLTDNFCERFGKVMILTGKGFPDVGTRLLLRKIWDQFKLPTFALVDADPHGIEIMLVYKYGSKNQAFENHLLTVPDLKWLGVLPSDIVKLSVQKSALQNLSDGDLQKLTDILHRPYAIPHSSFVLQVEMMVQSGVKAELQCLDSIDSSYLSSVYIPSKIQGGDWI